MALINSGSGGYIGRRFDVQLSAELRHKGDPIFERFFDGDNTSVVNIFTNTILVPNHFFRTGEEIRYEYAGFETSDDNAVGIGSTIVPSGVTIQSVGVNTSRLPLICYAVKIDDRNIQLSPTKEDSLKRIPNIFDLRSVGLGTFHKFIGEKQNTRSLITIDNVIQSPVIDTTIKTQLIDELSGASDLLFVTGITSFFTGDLIRVEDEIMRINLVGLGETTSLIVRRPMLGTKLADHALGSDVVKMSGNYKIVDNIIYFPVPPFEKSPTTDFERTDPLDRDYVGLETFSTFDGRVFLRSGFQDTSVGPYDRNYLLDDISDQFLGISTQASLKQQGQNISGFSTGNALVLINNVFQTPDFIDYGLEESAGITTIKFTGSSNSNPKDINTSSIPRGGIIVQVGTNEGSGYQPLVAAGGTALVSAAGTISNISIGYSGSGYRAPKEYILKTKINYVTNSPSAEFFIEDTNGIIKQLKYFIDSNPQAKCLLSVRDSVGINRIVTAENTRIVSVGNSSVTIQNGPDAWDEVSLATSYIFYASTNATQSSIGSTDRVRVASVSGINTNTEDYYVTIASVGTNIKIKEVDVDNKLFILDSSTSGGYVDNTSIIIKTQIPGIDNTNVGDDVYITVTNPNLGIANIYVNVDRQYPIESAPYTNTTGIVTITSPKFPVNKGEFVEIRGLKYKCTSGGSFASNLINYNKKVGIQSVFFGVSGIATVTTDGDVANNLVSGDLVLFNNTSTSLDGNIFTVTESPVSFGSSINAFKFNIGAISPPSNILNSSGDFVLATIDFPSGNLGYSFEVIDVNEDSLVLNVGKSPQHHEYVSGGFMRNLSRGRYLNHIGISTIYKGHIEKAEITNIGVGFTQYNLFSQYNLSESAQSGVNTLRLGNVSGINTYEFFVSVGTAITNSKIINLDSANKIITIGSTTPNGGLANETLVSIKKYDDFDLYIDDPLSYQDVNLVYSSQSVIGIGSYANANVRVGNDGKIKEFELLTTGYSFGQGEILTLPIEGPTGIATFGGIQVTGITTAIGILTGSISTTVNDQFGYSLASNYNGSSFIVGCPYDNHPNSEINSGIAYVFDRVGNNFNQIGIITGIYSYSQDDNFGWSVAMSYDGLKIAVSAPNDGSVVGINSGLVYMYDRVGNNFNQVGLLTGTYSTDFGDRFGWSVDMSNDGQTVVVGAVNDEFPQSSLFSGVAYVFNRQAPSTFSEVGILTGFYASNVADNFGFSISISPEGNHIIVGAVADEDNLSGTGNYGACYVFKKINSSYNNLVGILTAPKPANQKLSGDSFGHSVAISENGRIVSVGSISDRSLVGGNRTGLVYVFEYINDQYYLIDTLTGEYSVDTGDRFGSSISMSDDGKVIAIGADSDERPNSLQSSGVVYLFDRVTENYLGDDYALSGFTTGIYSKDLNDKYGTSVHVSNDKNSLIVGSIYDSKNNTDGVGIGTSGVVYVHNINTGNTFQEFQVTIDQTFTDEFSGYVFGDLIVFDSFDRLFNGKRLEFPIKLSGVQRTLRARPGSTLELEYNLIVFLNDIYQVPNQSYVFNGGSFITFKESPQKGDKCVVIFYYGTTEVDTRLVDILETIKIGDEVTLNSQFLSLQQNERVVTDIRSTDIIETNVYSSPGLSLDNQLKRPVTWCKQLVDKIIDGKVVGKSRVPYEPEIYPKSQLIKSVGIGSTEVIFVESLKTFFDSDDEYQNIGINKAPQNDIVLISNDVGIAGSASISIGSNLRISNITLVNPGSNYQESPEISISLPNYVGIGTTNFERATASCTIDSNGKISNVSLTNPGYGYTNSGNAFVFIAPPTIKYEIIEDVLYEGDFGWITGIGTTSTVGFKTNFVFEFYIPENSYLRDEFIGNKITESQIQPGYYFNVTKSNIGNVGFGFTSVNIYDNTKVFNGDKFLDGVYHVSSVGIARTQVPGLTVGSGRTDILRVVVPVQSYNGLDIPSGGFIGTVGGAPGVGYSYGKYFGDFSWGRISSLKRKNLKSFGSYINGELGISTSPTMIRLNPLKYLGYTPNPEE